MPDTQKLVYKTGDRVYYMDNGPDDKGTVMGYGDGGYYQVKWDDGRDTVRGGWDEYRPSQLGLVILPWIIVTDIGIPLGPFGCEEEAQRYFDLWEWEKSDLNSKGAYVAQIQEPYQHEKKRASVS